MKPFSSLAEVIRYIGSHYSNPTALNHQDSQGVWHSESTESFVRKVRYLTLALTKRGLRRGECVGIMAKPCPYWTIVDFAIILAGGVTVPLFGNSSPENLTFEVEKSGLKMLFVEGDAEWIKSTRHRDLFETIVCLGEHSPDDTAIAVSALLTEGATFDRQQPTLFDSILDGCQIDDLATIIFTSGSTGRPKGVQVTQSQLVSIIHQDPFGWDTLHDRYLSFLPLAHVFARCLNYIMVAWGVSIYYLEDPRAMLQATQLVRPTILVLVPRLLEKVRTKIINRIRESGYLLSRVGGWALRLAENQGHGSWISMQRWVADKLVYNSFRKAFGGKVRVIISGGAKLNEQVGRFFWNMGFPIYEGWGMTEGCPFTCNTYTKHKLGTVGPALAGVVVRVSPEGELLVRAPNVMRGYLEGAADKSTALDDQGWLHTGDKGSIDDDGFVKITGRLKELLKTSTGEWVVPLPIEQRLEELPFVDHALVVAEGRPFCTCLLFPDFDTLYGLKLKYGMADYSDIDFLNSAKVRDEVHKHLEEINRHVNHWEAVHDYRFVLIALSVDSGALTPTLKVRRGVVVERYEAIIESMYQRGVKP